MTKNKKISVVVLILAIVFVLVIRVSKKTTIVTEIPARGPINVSIQSVKDSQKLIQTIKYPAIVAGDQEVTVVAKSSGTVTKLDVNLGSRVGQGAQLATIDSVGSFSESGKKDLSSSDTQVLQLAVEQARQSLKLAKNNYKLLKNEANKRAKEIAEIQLESAEIAYRGSLDTRFIVSPISGVVTDRAVSLGDSVSVGQTIAKISKTSQKVVNFFVDKEELPNFKIGDKIIIHDNGREIQGAILRIAPEADMETKRFLIEAKPEADDNLLIGSVVNVSFAITSFPQSAENLILPLSAITIGQNESHIFLADGGKAKATSVSIESVHGEFAEIKAEIPAEAEIIVGGSKLVRDGDEIIISK